MSNILFYDADCGFCQAGIDYIQSQDINIVLEYISYQSLAEDRELQQYYSDVSLEEVNRGVQLLIINSDSQREVIKNHYAITYIFKYSNNIIFKGLAGLIDLPVINKISEFVYYLISQNRHRISRLMGKTSCRLSQ